MHGCTGTVRLRLVRTAGQIIGFEKFKFKNCGVLESALSTYPQWWHHVEQISGSSANIFVSETPGHFRGVVEFISSSFGRFSVFRWDLKGHKKIHVSLLMPQRILEFICSVKMFNYIVSLIKVFMNALTLHIFGV